MSEMDLGSAGDVVALPVHARSSHSLPFLDGRRARGRDLRGAGAAGGELRFRGGDDANLCARTSPCKIAGAFRVTLPGGTITALDPANFGSLTIYARNHH